MQTARKLIAFQVSMIGPRVSWPKKKRTILIVTAHVRLERNLYIQVTFVRKRFRCDTRGRENGLKELVFKHYISAVGMPEFTLCFCLLKANPFYGGLRLIVKCCDHSCDKRTFFLAMKIVLKRWVYLRNGSKFFGLSVP